jgi:hypothetical protein
MIVSEKEGIMSTSTNGSEKGRPAIQEMEKRQKFG